ncbi:MAG TPA: TAXI family TRAP transporter solute-binding subunit [Alphaproteobacteria bacterium]|nr:TAXI family TRAP transporter solute-binding subunit [Alphaproteobacteria bacterium]
MASFPTSAWRPWARAAALVLAAALLSASALASASAPAFAQDKEQQPALRYFRIGTSASDGSYFPIGGLIASAISSPPGARSCDQGGSCGVPGLIAIAQSTQGSVENVELIGKGRIESGLSQANVAHDAYAGRDRFARAPVRTLRAIAGLYREEVQIVVRADSGIRDVRDLRGKRIGVGAQGSGTLLDAELILDAYRVRRNQVHYQMLKPGEATDALKNQRIDALFMVAGAPNGLIADLAQSVPIRLLPISDQKFAELKRAHSSFGLATIPAGTYRGVGEVSALSIAAVWLTSSNVDAELVYGITKALWNGNARKLLDTGGPDGRQITLATALDGVDIPLHPGAERFYREVGLIKEAVAKTPSPTPTPAPTQNPPIPTPPPAQ